ncbi:glycosyltransferase family 4 protein [Pseudomonas sp. Irchel 3A7]|uniref:MraY family glycosyltransferase n=1 Tax=Pseudomonas sp. Irchel 3A7 TaxID=2008913 RepID=UPI000BA2EBCB|nr:glycosyltransferase family 4 protein [Pseudomonas sp. Irchel 3A7]
MIFSWLLLAILAVSCGLTLVLRRYALRKSLMDIPNERSSHTVPTPRGGGVAIVVSFALALPILINQGYTEAAAAYGLLGSGLFVAVIGFADDHGHIAARWRLLGHFIAAAWAIYFLSGLPAIEFFGSAFNLGWFGHILAAIYIVWMLNLYNFMDGIDGLASVQAISVCLGMCLVYWFSGNGELIWAPLILVAAVAGFLWWNFPPAKIFMGDAGSGFLGVVLATLSIVAAWVDPNLLWCWLILLGVFIVDATWTLARRLLRGEKVYQAHRSHAYQNASRVYSSHKAVTLGVLALNAFWLLPISMVVMFGGLSGGVGLIVAYLPLIFLSWVLKGGAVEAG